MDGLMDHGLRPRTPDGPGGDVYVCVCVMYIYMVGISAYNHVVLYI
jgi:hypothetical protein